MVSRKRLTQEEIEEIEYNAYLAAYEQNCDKAKSNFCTFMRMNDPTFLMNWHHRIISRRIEKMVKNPNRDRLIISVPPQTGKSTQVSVQLAPFALGINPNQKMEAGLIDKAAVLTMGKNFLELAQVAIDQTAQSLDLAWQSATTVTAEELALREQLKQLEDHRLSTGGSQCIRAGGGEGGVAVGIGDCRMEIDNWLSEVA